MYPAYFGLKEASFSITPDPQYLYLSPRHEEALAHLLYGASESGGFVLLTGEVGTGKTTVCRAFLERLPEYVDIALILNPALTVTELLHSVCGEFGIQVETRETSAKDLVDRINAYLLEAHANHRRPVLMIDEAQNLSPEVMEQIRLLTNLETAKHKLLQIFLVGQPELRDMLQQQDLRQLAQRITARYHLIPLNAAETNAYIMHRLAVAGVDRPLFSPSAMRCVYRLSGGVPRLINILCDRSLLGAYAGQSAQVDKSTVSRAWHELHGWDATVKRRGLVLALGLSAAVAVSAGAAWLAYPWQTSTQPEVAAGTPPADPKTVSATLAKPLLIPPVSHSEPPARPASEAELTGTPEPRTEPEFKPDISPLNGHVLDRHRAMTLLLRHWALELPSGLASEPCDLAETRGLLCKTGHGAWEELRRYARPALIRLSDGSGRQGHALLIGLSDTHAELDNGDTRLRVDLASLDALRSGEYLLFWKPAPGRRTLIGGNAPPESVHWLRERLAAVPEMTVSDPDSGYYDATLRELVRHFQAVQDLKTDGVVGPETLIRLNTLSNRADIPHLNNTF